MYLYRALIRSGLVVVAFFSSVLHTSAPGISPNTFPVSSLYSKAVLKLLKQTTDSLNNKFLSLAAPKTMYSRLAAHADFIYISDKQVLAALKDIKANLSFDSFIKKYQDITWERNVLVLRDTSLDYEGRKQIKYVGVEVAGSYSHSLDYIYAKKELASSFTGQWRYNYCPSMNGMTSFIEAFYFQTELQNQILPAKYAKYLQYADFVIGDPAYEFQLRKDFPPYRVRPAMFPNIERLKKYVAEETKKPEYEYSEAYQSWEQTRVKIVDSLLANKPQFITLLHAALDEALVKGGSDDELEAYVGKYISLSTKLCLMCNRQVWGYCSRDQAPNRHLLAKAALAAQLGNWPVFIRAQLDVLNDRVERNSDASFGALRRLTYVSELEAMGINVPDLFLGIALRIEGADSAHYFGNISRLSRAINESAYSDEIERRLLTMMQDNSLDDYNRILMYFLYQGSLSYNIDAVSKSKKLAELKVAVKGMPQYIASKITFDQ